MPEERHGATRQGRGPVVGGLVLPPGTGPWCAKGCRVGVGGVDGCAVDGDGEDGCGVEGCTVAGADARTCVGGGVAPSAPARVTGWARRAGSVGGANRREDAAAHPVTPRAAAASTQRCLWCSGGRFGSQA